MHPWKTANFVNIRKNNCESIIKYCFHNHYFPNAKTLLLAQLLSVFAYGQQVTSLTGLIHNVHANIAARVCWSQCLQQPNDHVISPCNICYRRFCLPTHTATLHFAAFHTITSFIIQLEWLANNCPIHTRTRQHGIAIIAFMVRKINWFRIRCQTNAMHSRQTKAKRNSTIFAQRINASASRWKWKLIAGGRHNGRREVMWRKNPNEKQQINNNNIVEHPIRCRSAFFNNFTPYAWKNI